MFTVMHSTKDKNQLYEAVCVTEFPHEREIPDGAPEGRKQPPSVFLLDRRYDTSGTHLYEGEVYVMNEVGKTVAHFRLTA